MAPEVLVVTVVEAALDFTEVAELLVAFVLVLEAVVLEEDAVVATDDVELEVVLAVVTAVELVVEVVATSDVTEVEDDAVELETDVVELDDATTAVVEPEVPEPEEVDAPEPELVEATVELAAVVALLVVGLAPVVSEFSVVVPGRATCPEVRATISGVLKTSKYSIKSRAPDGTKSIYTPKYQV